jgi:serine/threonine protein kinase
MLSSIRRQEGRMADRSLVPTPSIINGRYRVFGTSRSTPEAVIYAAEDLFVGGREVVLEVLRGDLAVDAEFVAALREQAGRLARPECAHRGIACVYGCDTTEDGAPFLVVEPTQGRRLQDVLDTGALDSYSAVLIASQVGEALEVLHRHGMVHGELTPESVIVVSGDDGKETVKLIGVEFAAAHRTAIGLRMRTAVSRSPYLAPEQTAGGETTQASDIYALGRLLRELLTGTKRGEADPTLGESRVVPPPMDRIIAKALEARPAARYRTVGAMITDMWRAENEIDDRPLRDGSPELPTSQAPRVRLAMVAAIIAIVSVTAVWIAVGDRLTARYRARTSAPATTSAPVAERAAAPGVPALPPPSAVTAPIEAASVPSIPAAATTETPMTKKPPTMSEGRPVEAPSASRRPALPAARQAPRRSTDAIASERSGERSTTAQSQRGEDDGSAIVDWLFKNRPGD